MALVNIANSQDIGSFQKYLIILARGSSFLMKSEPMRLLLRKLFRNNDYHWIKADYYDPKVASSSTWIYTIARNKKIDILRKPEKLY